MADVIAVFGPTASGKSAVAEAIAARIPADLVSADSTQVYRGLPLLTNQSNYPTQLVAIWNLDHEASVAEYQELAHAAIDAILFIPCMLFSWPAVTACGGSGSSWCAAPMTR